MNLVFLFSISIYIQGTFHFRKWRLWHMSWLFPTIQLHLLHLSAQNCVRFFLDIRKFIHINVLLSYSSGKKKNIKNDSSICNQRGFKKYHLVSVVLTAASLRLISCSKWNHNHVVRRGRVQWTVLVSTKGVQRLSLFERSFFERSSFVRQFVFFFFWLWPGHQK